MADYHEAFRNKDVEGALGAVQSVSQREGWPVLQTLLWSRCAVMPLLHGASEERRAWFERTGSALRVLKKVDNAAFDEADLYPPS